MKYNKGFVGMSLSTVIVLALIGGGVIEFATKTQAPIKKI